MRLAVVIMASVALASCQSSPPPDPPQPSAPKTPCQIAAEAYTNPWLTAIDKLAILEVMRNRGCLGQAPPTRIEIDQTVRLAPAQR